MSRGYFTGPNTTDAGSNRYTQSPCPIGRYCRDGVSTACPAGQFGDVTGLDSSSCSGPCAAGYYCDPGSATPSQHPCGNDSVFCPPGAATPLHALPGDVSLGPDSEHRNGTALCPERHYCLGGIAVVCPAGRFGCAAGLKSPECNGDCAAGYYCPAGSGSNHAIVCGGRHVFCPGGAGQPVPVGDGNYSDGGVSPEQQVAQARCTVGSFCVNGTKVRTPRVEYEQEWQGGEEEE